MIGPAELWIIRVVITCLRGWCWCWEDCDAPITFKDFFLWVWSDRGRRHCRWDPLSRPGSRLWYRVVFVTYARPSQTAQDQVTHFSLGCNLGRNDRDRETTDDCSRSGQDREWEVTWICNDRTRKDGWTVKRTSQDGSIRNLCLNYLYSLGEWFLPL